MLPDNVWDVITIMPKLTELDLLDCVFDSSKMHETLKTSERRSNNSIITATKNITIPTRELSSLSLSAQSLSLVTKLKLTVTNSRLRYDMIITIFKSKSKDRSDKVSQALVQNIVQSTVLENLEVGYFWVRYDYLKTLSTIKILHCFGFASVSGMSYYDE